MKSQRDSADINLNLSVPEIIRSTSLAYFRYKSIIDDSGKVVPVLFTKKGSHPAFEAFFEKKYYSLKCALFNKFYPESFVYNPPNGERDDLLSVLFYKNYGFEEFRNEIYFYKFDIRDSHIHVYILENTDLVDAMALFEALRAGQFEEILSIDTNYYLEY